MLLRACAAVNISHALVTVDCLILKAQVQKIQRKHAIAVCALYKGATLSRQCPVVQSGVFQEDLYT